MTTETKKEIIAAFDFDGTLTYRDTLIPYIQYFTDRYHTAINLIGVVPAVIQFFIGQKTRQQVKETFLTNTIGGIQYAELQAKGTSFAHECIEKLLNPEGLKKLSWHQSEGHRCILVSATLSAYLQPWVEEIGFQDLLCSQLEVDTFGRATGKLQGLNCWGQEKARLLQRLIGAKQNYLLYAYGDSRGDREMLNMADFPFYRKFW